jgi:hypothetical protein
MASEDGPAGRGAMKGVSTMTVYVLLGLLLLLLILMFGSRYLVPLMTR